MKILDRYIIKSVVAAFVFGLGLFLVLFMAMNLLREFVSNITEKNVPVMIALEIFGLRIPGILVYAFPMALLLSILLVFNRMSSESEMTAIRAAGVSFNRIVLPTLLVAIGVTLATFWISDRFAPLATDQAMTLLRKAAVDKWIRVNPVHENSKKQIEYTVVGDLYPNESVIKRLTMTRYTKGAPRMLIYAERAVWSPDVRRWKFKGKIVLQFIGSVGYTLLSSSEETEMNIISESALQFVETPDELKTARRYPEDFSAAEIRQRIETLHERGTDPTKVLKWEMGLHQRYAVPFTCIVFALIGAPLGLRHHRTSSAMGLGISLLIIFAYYSVSVYMDTFGDSGKMAPWLAAWLPNILGSVVGIILLWRANR
ncbi:MAG: LptF/LptG family permease [Armatimonadota bacterium]